MSRLVVDHESLQVCALLNDHSVDPVVGIYPTSIHIYSISDDIKRQSGQRKKDIFSSYIRQSTNKDIRAVFMISVVFGCVQIGNKIIRRVSRGITLREDLGSFVHGIVQNRDNNQVPLLSLRRRCKIEPWQIYHA
jgi:hypothetical protein